MRIWNNRPYDPEYEKVRKQVLRRDKYTCQYPNCSSKKKLQVHHILTYSDAELLRKNPKNLITLCKYHHQMVWGNESNYAQMFYEIVNGSN